jgi:hypothetical protein
MYTVDCTHLIHECEGHAFPDFRFLKGQQFLSYGYLSEQMRGVPAFWREFYTY